jgi:chemotaxis protein MotA
MVKRAGWRIEYATVAAMVAAIAVVVIAQFLEGAGARSLWQPTAALVVFGGTLAALFVSYPAGLVLRSGRCVVDVFSSAPAGRARRDPRPAALRASVAADGACSRSSPRSIAPLIPFLARALGLIVDGTETKRSRVRC